MSEKITAFLSTPIAGTVRQPLRVAIYSRIAEGIRTQIFVPGSALPTEFDLGDHLGVSRTVVREALMLLEEDGLIVTRRGIGRFVASQLPKIGLEQLRPLEEIVASAEHPISIRRVAAELQTATDFSKGELQLAEDARIWFVESVLSRGKDKIALVQEYLPAEQALIDFSPALADSLKAHLKAPATLLGLLIALLGAKLTQSKYDITVGVAGAIRGRLLSLRPTDPVLLMTQTVFLGGKPLYLAKHIVSAKAGHLSVMQTVQF